MPTYRLDFAYPFQRVAVEYDGEEFHSSKEQKRADAERREWLHRNGWTVIVVRKDGFTGQRLDTWLRQLRQALSDHGTNRRWRPRAPTQRASRPNSTDREAQLNLVSG